MRRSNGIYGLCGCLLLSGAYAADCGREDIAYYLREGFTPAGRGLFGRQAEQPQKQDAEEYRPAEGIDIDRPETHFADFLGTMRETPLAVWTLAKGQGGQVMLYILTGGECLSACHWSF